MKKIVSFIIAAFFVLSSFVSIHAQSKDEDFHYKAGEVLKYRLHYGPITGGHATLSVHDKELNGKPHFHVVGEGRSSGSVDAFFRIRDRYESYVDKETQKPSKFVRDIKEGKHSRNVELDFSHEKKSVDIWDKKTDKRSNYRFFKQEMHDMLSAFYRLRNIDTSELKEGDEIQLDIFMDEKIYNFRLEVLGREKLSTRFGAINAIKILPHVKRGRIFKAEESVTMWISDDKNHVPLSIQAELKVGKLKADLKSYKGLKYPINFVKEHPSKIKNRTKN